MSFEKYDKMSYEELEQAKRVLDKQRQDLRLEMLHISRLMDVKAVEKKFDALPTAEQAALTQVIKTRGIPTEERVKGPASTAIPVV